MELEFIISYSNKKGDRDMGMYRHVKGFWNRWAYFVGAVT
jgi:hypothetical protein